MPYLKIQNNHELESQVASELLQQASRAVAEQLAKPERYVMVAMEPRIPMLFAGNNEPAVFMQLKSICLSESQTPELSRILCKLVQQTTGVDVDQFTDAPRKMWGWNGTTF